MIYDLDKSNIKNNNAENNAVAIQEIKENIEILEEEYNDAVFSKRKLEWEKTTLDNSLQKKEANLKKLSDNNNGLAVIINEMKAKLVEKQSKMPADDIKTKQKIDKLEQNLKESDTKGKELEESLKKAQEETEKLKSSLDEANRRLQDLMKNNKISVKQISQI